MNCRQQALQQVPEIAAALDDFNSGFSGSYMLLLGTDGHMWWDLGDYDYYLGSLYFSPRLLLVTVPEDDVGMSTEDWEERIRHHLRVIGFGYFDDEKMAASP